MFQSSTRFFDRLMRKYTPDPFVLALLLSFFIIGNSVLFTKSTFKETVVFWGDGFWQLIIFTMQMAMILLGGYVFASTQLIKKCLHMLAMQLKTPGQAIVVTSLLSLIGCWFNWGFGLVIGALFCREVIHHVPKANFRLLVASAYSGFLIWHGGLSASIPLVIATPGNFTEDLLGRIIPVTETLFSAYNLIAIGLLMIALPITNWLMGRSHTENTSFHPTKTPDPLVKEPSKEHRYPAEKMDYSLSLVLVACCLGFLYMIFKIYDGTFKLDLNTTNYFFIFFGLAFHKNAHNFIASINQGAQKVGPILIQFPIYGAIMGVMQHSGLAEIISQFFVQISTAKTFPLLTFYSAGLLNLFIPSGGGQWAVQAPIVIAAAKDLQVDLAITSMAVAWGDAWTNMLQPFWALPILSIAGIKLREIMGYCVLILVVSGSILSVVFLVTPLL